MVEKRSSALREILRPWLTRFLVGLPVFAALYQFGCDQFDWPKLPVLWGMTGGGLPWWGWLLIAQAGFVYALFEYVRRVTSRPLSDGAGAPTPDYVPSEQVEEIRLKIENLELSVSRNTANIDGVTQAVAGVQDDLGENARLASQNEAGVKATMAMVGEVQKIAFGDIKELRERLRAHGYAISAITHREILLTASDKIEALTRLMGLEENGGSLVDKGAWARWELNYHELKTNLERWAIFASVYRPDISSIKNVPGNLHKLKWHFDDNTQFPDLASAHEYKIFRSLTTNWENAKGAVHDEVRKVASGERLPASATNDA